MDRKKTFKKYKNYIENECLNNIIDFHEHSDYKKDAIKSVSGTLRTPIPPDIKDLVRLHKLIRKRKSFTVLEFGVGYSSLIIADALNKNEADWNKLQNKPVIRNSKMFQLFSIDTSNHWIEQAKNRFTKELLTRVNFLQSDAEMTMYNGQVCHLYKKLPDIVPDFIYLDGPSAREVKGEIHGLSYKCMERTPISADILLLESTLLPGAIILVDGRTNNARFLERNLTRDYEIIWDKINDVTTFELKEERLGKYNTLGIDFFD